jgi:hypothetical protein
MITTPFFLVSWSIDPITKAVLARVKVDGERTYEYVLPYSVWMTEILASSRPYLTKENFEKIQKTATSYTKKEKNL